LYTCTLVSSQINEDVESESVQYPSTVLLRIYGLILQVSSIGK